MNDSEIIQLYVQRDENAIRETDRKYGAYCHTVARNILGIDEDVQECVNDTWYQAWISIPPTMPENLRVWLAKIVRNISLNTWKKQRTKKRYSGMELLLDELEECIPSGDSLEKQLEDAEIGALISGWLRTLPVFERRIFLLRYFEGQGVQQIAARENTKAAKISKKLFLLRGQLKKVLEREGVVL
jgi:RNA polymerase sigma-70 factor (ECF subfamily)